MPWIGGAIAAGGSLLGGMFGSSSARSAAKKQARAMQAAVEEQKRQFNITREDQAPWMDAGESAVNRLSYLLGLGSAVPDAPSLNAIKAELRASGNYDGFEQGTPVYGRVDQYGVWRETPFGLPASPGSDRFTPETRYRFSDGSIGTASVQKISAANTAALNAEAQRIYEERLAAAEKANSDPAFGSLTRNFTMADFEADPVAQLGFEYGLNQGTSAINKRAAAMGGYDSGATLKALTRFGNDYGNTKANESYNRFVNNQTNLFNRLSGLSGTGQQSANFVGAAGANMASNVGNLYAGMGNARGAASIAQGNAWSNALGGVANALGNAWTQYQQPQNQGFYPGTYNGPVVYGTSYGE